jgi:hypothetical protein
VSAGTRRAFERRPYHRIASPAAPTDAADCRPVADTGLDGSAGSRPGWPPCLPARTASIVASVVLNQNCWYGSRPVLGDVEDLVSAPAGLHRASGQSSGPTTWPIPSAAGGPPAGSSSRPGNARHDSSPSRSAASRSSSPPGSVPVSP